MKNLLLATLAVSLSLKAVWAEELNPNIASTTASIKIGAKVEVTEKPKPVFRNIICNFSVTPGRSSPPSWILAGKVVSDNSLASEEFVPIFFGSPLHHPRLAALTNVAGEFRFRVWMSKVASDNSLFKLEATDINDSTLYLEGNFNGEAEMLSSHTTHIHSLGDFLKQHPQKEEQPQH